MTERICLSHSDEVSGMTFLGPGRVALWSEGRSSSVDLFQAPLMDADDESMIDWGQVQHTEVPCDDESLNAELDEVYYLDNARGMTPTEEILYDVLRNLKKA
jgi:hypothetical protein